MARPPPTPNAYFDSSMQWRSLEAEVFEIVGQQHHAVELKKRKGEKVKLIELCPVDPALNKQGRILRRINIYALNA